MRKLSAAPLFILILLFLWTRFASAAPADISGDLLQARASQLPPAPPSATPPSLPAKKKLVTVLPAKKRKVVVVTLPAKKSGKVIVLPAKSTNAAGLPKQLPARTKVVMNFDQPALPDAPAVVIRELPATSTSTSTAPMSENEIETIRKHDFTEAPSLETVREGDEGRIEIPNEVVHKLKPALPDSDSYVALPAGLARAPQQPRVYAPQIVVSRPAQLTKPLVTSINPPQTRVTPQVTPQVITAPSSSATSVAVGELEAPASPPAIVRLDKTDLPAEPSDLPPLPESVTQDRSTLIVAPNEFIGPPPPPIFDTTSERTDAPPVATVLTESEQAIESEKGARTEGYEVHSAPAVQTTFLIPRDETPRRRVFVSGGYLDAKYSRLESDLKNGATILGLSVSQVFSKTEVRLGLDVAHGLDQEVSLRNIRMAIFRAEGLYTVFSRDIFDAYVGGELGLADIDVTSYHATPSSSDITIRENAKGTALLGAPEVGTRFRLSREISLDITLSYLLLAGSDQIANLGGLLGAAAVGFSF